jgi:hypothetical protein
MAAVQALVLPLIVTVMDQQLEIVPVAVVLVLVKSITVVTLMMKRVPTVQRKNFMAVASVVAKSGR